MKEPQIALIGGGSPGWAPWLVTDIMAWMLNVSNPLAVLTRTVEKVSPIRAFGICHGIDEMVEGYARMIGVEGPASFRAAGTNHCSRFLDFRVGDADVLAEIKARLDGGWQFDEDQQELVAGYSPCLKLYQALGYLPAIQGRHIVEFFPFFLHDVAQVEHYGVRRASVSHRGIDFFTSRCYPAATCRRITAASGHIRRKQGKKCPHIRPSWPGAAIATRAARRGTVTTEQEPRSAMIRGRDSHSRTMGERCYGQR